MSNELANAWVFPIRPNTKEPFGAGSWKDQAFLADSPEGRALFAQVAAGQINYAIWTGKSGLTVVDIDPKKFENEPDVDVDAIRATFPPTLTVKTPSGGYHLIYKNQDSYGLRPRVRVEPGVDVRTGDSYIVGYGSRIGDDKYRRYTMDPPQPISSEVYDRLSRKDREHAQVVPDLLAGEMVSTGQIDNTLTSLAGKARFTGMEYLDVLQYLEHINSSGRVNPPAAQSDLERIARSVCNYAVGDVKVLKTKAKIKEREEPLFQPYSQVVPMITRWLWLNRVPSVGITALCGEPEVGKTYMMTKLAADLSSGTQLPFSHVLEPMSVVLYTGEDTATEIKDRLERCGANMDRVWRFSSAAGVIDAQMWSKLDKFLIDHPEVRLVCIDPSAAFLSGADIRNEQEVRDSFEEMRQIAENREIAFIFMRHLAKKEGSIVSRILDSVAFRAIPRSILAATGEDAKQLSHVKNNMGEKQPPIAFRIDNTGFHWMPDEPVKLPTNFNKDLSKLARATALLRTVLGLGPQSLEAIKEEAAREGLTYADLNNAAAKTIVVVKDSASKTWKLPD